MLRIAFAAVAVLASAASTRAQSPSLDSLTEGGRYALLELNEQVVRLDTDTGVFSLCQMEGSVWSCTLTIDERQVLEDRIAALTRRVEALERAAASSVALLPAAVPPAAGPPPLARPAAPGAAPAADGLPPLAAPREVPDAPVPLRSLAAGDPPKPERRGWFRRAAGLLPFVD